MDTVTSWPGHVIPASSDYQRGIYGVHQPNAMEHLRAVDKLELNAYTA